MSRARRKPWDAGPSFSHGTWSYEAAGEPVVIAIPHSRAGLQRLHCVPADRPADAEDIANVRLMSAAPELYRELLRAHRFLRKLGYDMDSINNAINLARFQGGPKPDTAWLSGDGMAMGL